MKPKSAKREKPRRPRVTRNQVAELRRMMESETRPAFAVKGLKEWAKKRKDSLNPSTLEIIMRIPDGLSKEAAWAKIEVILDLLDAEAANRD
ncbi:MAG: hypothetical protein ACLP5V_02985 [Candidatus Bathyarchaeia archaeon]